MFIWSSDFFFFRKLGCIHGFGYLDTFLIEEKKCGAVDLVV